MTEYWKDVDAILMGRKTYDVAVSSGRETSTGKKQSKNKPQGKSAVRTHVFSRTLQSIDEPGVELVTEDAVTFVSDLKRRTGREFA
jgi:dihydrofolate reductase